MSLDEENNLMDSQIEYEQLIEEALQNTQDEDEVLRYIMKKTRGLANPYLLKEKIAKQLKRPQE